MKCKGCGFPFPPHELREEQCFECVWKRLECAEKQAAAMREALVESHQEVMDGITDPLCLERRIDAALQSNAGRDYISKESVLAALDSAKPAEMTWEALDMFDRLTEAFRTLGL